MLTSQGPLMLTVLRRRSHRVSTQRNTARVGTAPQPRCHARICECVAGWWLYGVAGRQESDVGITGDCSGRQENDVNTMGGCSGRQENVE